MPHFHLVVRKLTDTVEMQRGAIEELYKFNNHAYSIINALNVRIMQLEDIQNNSDITSRVTQFNRNFMSSDTHVSQSGRAATNSSALAATSSQTSTVAKQRKKLTVKIPSPSDSVRICFVPSVPNLTLSGFSYIANVRVRVIVSFFATRGVP